MSQPDQFEMLILGSGKGGKLLAWHMAQMGRRTAVVERRWIGGSCPNVAYLPSKNEIWRAWSGLRSLRNREVAGPGAAGGTTARDGVLFGPWKV